MELKTVIPYSHRIYGIFGVTAPEGVELSPLLAPGPALSRWDRAGNIHTVI